MTHILLTLKQVRDVVRGVGGAALVPLDQIPESQESWGDVTLEAIDDMILENDATYVIIDFGRPPIKSEVSRIMLLWDAVGMH